jgi:hypothetical protein
MRVRTSLLLIFMALPLLGSATTRTSDSSAGKVVVGTRQVEPLALRPSDLLCAAPAITAGVAAARPLPLINTICNSCSDSGCVGQTFGGSCPGGRKCIVDHKCSTDTGWACVCGGQ